MPYEERTNAIHTRMRCTSSSTDALPAVISPTPTTAVLRRTARGRRQYVVGNHSPLSRPVFFTFIFVHFIRLDASVRPPDGGRRPGGDAWLTIDCRGRRAPASADVEQASARVGGIDAVPDVSAAHVRRISDGATRPHPCWQTVHRLRRRQPRETRRQRAARWRLVSNLGCSSISSSSSCVGRRVLG